jgi:hypothetical protein
MERDSQGRQMSALIGLPDKKTKTEETEKYQNDQGICMSASALHFKI